MEFISARVFFAMTSQKVPRWSRRISNRLRTFLMLSEIFHAERSPPIAEVFHRFGFGHYWSVGRCVALGRQLRKRRLRPALWYRWWLQLRYAVSSFPSKIDEAFYALRTIWYLCLPWLATATNRQCRGNERISATSWAPSASSSTTNQVSYRSLDYDLNNDNRMSFDLIWIFKRPRISIMTNVPS